MACCLRWLGAWVASRSLSLRDDPELGLERARDLLRLYLDLHVGHNCDGIDRALLVYAALLEDVRPATLSALGISQPNLRLKRLSSSLPMLTVMPGGAFRLHDLLRDYILELAETSRTIDDACLAVAREFESLGRLDRSLELLTRSKRVDALLDLLNRRGVGMVQSGNTTAVLRAIDSLPINETSEPAIRSLRMYCVMTLGGRPAGDSCAKCC